MRYTNAQIAKVVKYIIENVEMLNNALDDALRVTEIEQQNKRYREALEFYAGGKHVAYKLDETDDDLVVDYGETARKALGSEENEMR